MGEHDDVIVIGTGAGGGTLARRLAPSGKRILLLERGDWLPRDPATSVLNTDCRAHELGNLYVVDTSFFPSIGAVNPPHGDGQRHPGAAPTCSSGLADRRISGLNGGNR
jgi:choline dehydrogenase-like flavoprotein